MRDDIKDFLKKIHPEDLLLKFYLWALIQVYGIIVVEPRNLII